MNAYTGALLGGALIGTGAALMLLFNGKIAGISGIVGGLLRFQAGDFAWRLAFTGGLIAGGVVFLFLDPSVFQINTGRPLPVIAAAGVLVGFGTAMGTGCTSGHGICGVSRLSRRSIVATVIFILSGMATVFVYNLAAG